MFLSPLPQIVLPREMSNPLNISSTPEIADHIAGFLDGSYLPGPGAVSRTFINSHAIHGSFEVFARTLFDGTSFMRTSGARKG